MEKQLTKLKNKGYIYKVTNIITGQFYIGQRSSFEGTPEDDLGIHYFTSSKVVRPLFKNNTSEWKKEILYSDIQFAETLDDMEGFAIHRQIKDKLCLNGYDPTSRHGFRTMAGKHLSDETRRKISEAKKNMSDETKFKLSEAQKGKHQSEETKRKMSEAHKGVHQSEEAKRKNSEAHRGNSATKGKHWKCSEEAKRHISEAHKGKHHSEETKRKISEAHKGRKAWNKGKPLSDEARRKLSEAHKGKHHSDEARRHMSEA